VQKSPTCMQVCRIYSTLILAAPGIEMYGFRRNVVREGKCITLKSISGSRKIKGDDRCAQ
jgi:hypothetical protein